MSLEKELSNRSGGVCELCGESDNLSAYLVVPKEEKITENHVYICSNCISQVENPEKIEPNHWRCLNDSMWPAVQVISWRMLNHLKGEGWPLDLLDMMYLEEETLAWAKAMDENLSDEDNIKHIDSNGVVLQTGDTVVLTKDLNVKGSSMVAKRGTAVRRISLDHENEKWIEGKVDGIQIVIITEYVKKL